MTVMRSLILASGFLHKSKSLIHGNGFKQRAIIVALLATLAGVNYKLFLTNEYTPSGDGHRIYNYLKYLEMVPEVIPTWHGHKNHGYPLLADPENHLPIALLTDTESPFFNLQLNAVFFVLTIVLAYSCFVIGRTLNLVLPAAGMAGAVTIVTVPTMRCFAHGSVSSFLTISLCYAALAILMTSVGYEPRRKWTFVLIACVFLAYTVQIGYYLPIYFHAPALVFLWLRHRAAGQDSMRALTSTITMLFVVTVVFSLLSMPILLPILDGVLLSETFSTESPSINVLSGTYYDYLRGLWPFIPLAILLCDRAQMATALALAALAIPNGLIVLLDHFEVETFFSLWQGMPVLRNIRWQHPFLELSSIASALCCGFYLQSCLSAKGQRNPKLIIIGSVIGSLALLTVSINQLSTEVSRVEMLWAASVIFAVLFIARHNKTAATVGSAAILLVMVMHNWTYSSPADWKDGRFQGALNDRQFSHRKPQGYAWWSHSGHDPFTPAFRFIPYSMVFLQEYRTLLSLLYDKPIQEQRPHWFFQELLRSGDLNGRRDAIEELMAIEKWWLKKTTDSTSFRIYDEWVISDHDTIITLMSDAKFSTHGPILLERDPGINAESSRPLASSAKLTGKTAETMTFAVSTNKNGVLLIPEIWHRDWQATVDGEPAPVLKAYASLRAIPLREGAHRVELKFVYLPYRFGVAIALFVLSVYVWILLRLNRRSQPKVTPTRMQSIPDLPRRS